MQIRPSVTQDIPGIMNVIAEAQASLKNLNISQWQNGYPNPAAFAEDIRCSSSYVLEENGIILATAAIIFGGDPAYDNVYEGAWYYDLPYCAVHRIAVSSSKRGKGLAGALLHYAWELCRQKNISLMRIDTHEGNIPMQHFLEKNGFVKRGIIYLHEEKTAEDRRLAFEAYRSP